MRTSLLIVFFTYMLKGWGQVSDISYKTHGNIANYFENADDMEAVFDFRNGEVVAEIGAGDGQNIGGIGLLIDSCTFYIQDIDAKVLNQTAWEKIKKKNEKSGMSSRHQFNLVIGDEKSTHLPDSIFDKIMMVSSFHEFTYMDEMIEDIKSKLKTGGRVYILETKCLVHTNYTPEETIDRMKKHGFSMLQRIQTQRNGSEGLYILSFYIE
jgi:ubiquinone/menaquinone biosynthesis C-methylase UbiE